MKKTLEHSCTGGLYRLGLCPQCSNLCTSEGFLNKDKITLAILQRPGLPELLTTVLDQFTTPIALFCIDQNCTFMHRGDQIAVAFVLRLYSSVSLNGNLNKDKITLAILQRTGLPALLSIVINNIITSNTLVCIEQISNFLVKGGVGSL